MDQYKIGNKAKCIIRGYSAGQYGNDFLTYDNQPYTILKDVEVELHFNSKEVKANGGDSRLKIGYNVDFLQSITISNVLLTDKILSLIYSKNELKLCSTSENYISDENKTIFFNTSAEQIYQVFIYDKNGQLEQAIGTYQLAQNGYSIQVAQANASYLICYSFIGEYAVNLQRNNNIYLTLDFEIASNINDTTSTMWLHIDKCMMSVEKTLSFTDRNNRANLVCLVINDNNNNCYLTLK